MKLIFHWNNGIYIIDCVMWQLSMEISNAVQTIDKKCLNILLRYCGVVNSKTDLCHFVHVHVHIVEVHFSYESLDIS